MVPLMETHRQIFNNTTQDASVLSEISKTVFKVFSSSNIKEVTDLINLTVSEHQKRREPAENGKIV